MSDAEPAGIAPCREPVAEGGDPACWMHLVEDLDGEAEAHRDEVDDASGDRLRPRG